MGKQTAQAKEVYSLRDFVFGGEKGIGAGGGAAGAMSRVIALFVSCF